MTGQRFNYIDTEDIHFTGGRETSGSGHLPSTEQERELYGDIHLADIVRKRAIQVDLSLDQRFRDNQE